MLASTSLKVPAVWARAARLELQSGGMRGTPQRPGR